MIYVAIDGDDIGRKLASCYFTNRVDNLIATKDLVDIKTQKISDLLLDLGYEVFFCAADGVSGALNAIEIDSSSLYNEIAKIAGEELSFSVGVGKSLHESYVALLYAKSTGKARICDYRSICLNV
jgi:hypothetical protein